MAMSDDAPAQNSGDRKDSSSTEQERNRHDGGSCPDNSSRGHYPALWSPVAAPDSSAADADASPSSTRRDSVVKAQDTQGQRWGPPDSRRTTALSYFAPSGAGRLTFSPPAGICSRTNLRIQPFVWPPGIGESSMYDVAPSRDRATQPGERTPPKPPEQRQAGALSLAYSPSISDGRAAALKESASSELIAPPRPPAATSTLYLGALCPGGSREGPLSTRPPVLPASFVRSPPWLGASAAGAPRQTGGAAKCGGRAPANLISQRYPVEASDINSRQLPRQEQTQVLWSSAGQKKPEESSTTPVAFFVGTPRKSQYYQESGSYPEMKSAQQYTHVPLLHSRKSGSAGGEAGRLKELDSVHSRRLQQALQMMQKHDMRGNATNRHAQYWVSQALPPGTPRGAHERTSRRRRRGLWDCYEELLSPRDLLPMLSASQSRLSRNLRENLQVRRRDFSQALQRIQDAVSRYYQQLRGPIWSEYPHSSRYAYRSPQQQSAGGSAWMEVGREGRLLSPRVGVGTSPYVIVHSEPLGSGDATEPVKGHEAAQLIWKDGRVFCGDPALQQGVLVAEAAAPTAGDGQGAEGFLLKSAWQPRREGGATEIVTPSSARVVNGNYYIATEPAATTRACPTCGGPQVLVPGESLLAARAPVHGVDPGGGALQRLSEGDVDGCLKRLGEWRCTLCSDVAEAVDDEVLHTGGVVQEGGEWVDQMVAVLVRGVFETLRSLFTKIPRPSTQVVEGYPLYEPDYTYMPRKGRPTSLTGNFCIDQLNAFLDACLVGEDPLAPLPKPPPVPPTTRTGHWLIDAANAALDKLTAESTSCASNTAEHTSREDDGSSRTVLHTFRKQAGLRAGVNSEGRTHTGWGRNGRGAGDLRKEPPPPPPRSYKGFCPPVETLVPPCCRTTPLLPPRPPPPQAGICPLWESCGSAPPKLGMECPECHQPLRSGVCPVESRRERRLKKFFRECLAPAPQAVAPPPAPLYAYEASPAGYYVPAGPRQPGTDYYLPARLTRPATEYYTSAQVSAPLGTATQKQMPGRVYCAPPAPAAERQAGLATTTRRYGTSGAAVTSQYPYAPIYATQPCSEGFTVDSAARCPAQPRA